nr:hypothetical protein Iba_chr02aCG21160 [Ipomoea batatas]
MLLRPPPDGKNLVRWRKAMETPRHPSPVAPRRLRKYGRHGHFIGTGRPTSTTVSVSVSGEQKEGLAAMVAGGGGAEEKPPHLHGTFYSVGMTSVQIKINNQPPRNLKRYMFVNVTDQMIQLDDMLRKIVHGCSIARPNKLQYDHLVKEEWND